MSTIQFRPNPSPPGVMLSTLGQRETFTHYPLDPISGIMAVLSAAPYVPSEKHKDTHIPVLILATMSHVWLPKTTIVYPRHVAVTEIPAIEIAEMSALKIAEAIVERHDAEEEDDGYDDDERPAGWKPPTHVTLPPVPKTMPIEADPDPKMAVLTGLAALAATRIAVSYASVAYGIPFWQDKMCAVDDDWYKTTQTVRNLTGAVRRRDGHTHSFFNHRTVYIVDPNAPATATNLAEINKALATKLKELAVTHKVAITHLQRELADRDKGRGELEAEVQGKQLRIDALMAEITEKERLLAMYRPEIVFQAPGCFKIKSCRYRAVNDDIHAYPNPEAAIAAYERLATDSITAADGPR